MSKDLWIPVRPLLKKGGKPGMWICGFATMDNVVDLDQEVLNAAGLIGCLDYLAKHGKINWNHGDKPEDLLGDITKAEIRTDPTTGEQGLYIEARLNPQVPGAVAAYRYIEGGGKLGYSVQGVYLDVIKTATQEGLPLNSVKAAFISQVALTPEPKNHATDARILKSARSRTIAKALLAGSGTDHASFTGGRALIPENLGTLSVTQMDSLADDFRKRLKGMFLSPFEKAVALQQYGRIQGLFPGQVHDLAHHIAKGETDA